MFSYYILQKNLKAKYVAKGVNDVIIKTIEIESILQINSIVPVTTFFHLKSSFFLVRIPINLFHILSIKIFSLNTKKKFFFYLIVLTVYVNKANLPSIY